ncbi:hypothetical protein KAR91_30165 [Candidatus Pacearchaeota archaeon]|nr:hypothetical protein [Candidatus Pacearchaeota archaeon]
MKKSTKKQILNYVYDSRWDKMTALLKKGSFEKAFALESKITDSYPRKVVKKGNSLVLEALKKTLRFHVYTELKG